MGRIVTLTGPSGCGKSTALTYFVDALKDSVGAKIISKYTTRAARADDGPETITVTKIPPSCDIVYEQYGTRYGVSSDLIYDVLAEDSIGLLILNDVRAVEDLRMRLGDMLVTHYVFRERPDLEKTLQLAKDRGVDDLNAVEQRYRKALAIHRIYTENIHLFDRVLVNWGELENLKGQVRQVVPGLVGLGREWPLRSN